MTSSDIHAQHGAGVALPVYMQIAEALLAQIEAGALPPGSRLPPERELSKQFGVNRLTLRQALDVLDKQGMLLRRQGDGTYVAQPRIERAAGRLFPFSFAMQRRGYLPSARIIVFERLNAEAAVARQLEIAVAAPVYFSRRLRLINHEPVMLETFYVPAERFPHLERHDLAQNSLYATMKESYGVQIDQARQSLEPVIASAYEAELLGIGAGAPLMLERRITYDTTGAAVEWSKDLYRGDRFRFITELAPLEPSDF
ncbi:MAG: GntR family transcriptional regulator [Oscillochloris sp.]|nr:GntR family transcriptional regulator [Oscillochloris sp.]